MKICMHLSGLSEVFSLDQLLSVLDSVKKRKYVHECVSRYGQHLFPVMAEEKDMLVRKHWGSWQTMNPQSNEEKAQHQLLVPGHIHNRKERPKDEQLPTYKVKRTS